MTTFRVNRIHGYTIMSSHHLRNRRLTLKAKGLLSQMLSLPDDWDYTLKGLAAINRESLDAIRSAVHELETAGYLVRQQGRDERGRMTGSEYMIYEQSQSDTPSSENPTPVENIQQNNKPQNNKNIKIGMNDYSKLFREVKTQIGHDTLTADPRLDRIRVDEIVMVVTDVLANPRDTIRIGGRERDTRMVQERFRRLDADHVRYVLESLDRNTTRIRDMHGYLKTALYNAPATIANHYANEATVDIANGVIPKTPDASGRELSE